MKIKLINTDYNLTETENEIVSIEIQPNLDFFKIIELLIIEINKFETENKTIQIEPLPNFDFLITTEQFDQIEARIIFIP